MVISQIFAEAGTNGPSRLAVKIKSPKRCPRTNAAPG
jgi:hypothetical protein